MTAGRAEWGERLDALRIRDGLGKTELGRQVGAGYRTILRWGQGVHLPQPENRERLAAIGPDYAALVAELPQAEEALRNLGRRVAVLEKAIADLQRGVPASTQKPQSQGN